MKKLVREKLKVLKELCIKVTPSQVERIKACATEIALDNYVHKIIVDSIDYGTRKGNGKNERLSV